MRFVFSLRMVGWAERALRMGSTKVSHEILVRKSEGRNRLMFVDSTLSFGQNSYVQIYCCTDFLFLSVCWYYFYFFKV